MCEVQLAPDVKVPHDLTASDKALMSVLVLLELSAAPDKRCHHFLSDRTENVCGVKGSTANWFRSWLPDQSLCPC